MGPVPPAMVSSQRTLSARILNGSGFLAAASTWPRLALAGRLRDFISTCYGRVPGARMLHLPAVKSAKINPDAGAFVSEAGKVRHA